MVTYSPFVGQVAVEFEYLSKFWVASSGFCKTAGMPARNKGFGAEAAGVSQQLFWHNCWHVSNFQEWAVDPWFSEHDAVHHHGTAGVPEIHRAT